MKRIKVSVFLLGLCASVSAYAIAPVVDAYDGDGAVSASSSSSSNNTTNNTSSDNARSFSLEQRLSIQEHQIANLNPLLVQTDDLTQKMQLLQGKVEEQAHRLKRLEEQVRSQYLDLEKRLSQRQAFVSTESSVSSVKQNSPSTTNPLPAAAAKKVANAPNTVHTPPAPSNLPTAAGERDYQAAFQLLKNKHYAPATEGFEAFIKKYPSDINLPNAHYFLGQLYLLQGQPEQSITRFNDFVTHYPQDARVPDALLQLGLAYFAKGEKTVAMDTFKKIIQQYPDSKAAQAAQARLQQFQAMISAANMSSKKA
jgi:tol-pal system protein YbgF